MLERDKIGEKVLEGIPVSSGVCHGKVLVLGGQPELIECRKISKDQIPDNIKRFQEALITTRRQILEMQKKVQERMGSHDASIFDAHLLMIEDPLLIDEVIRTIEQDEVCVEYAFQQAADKYISVLNEIDDNLLRERAADLRDVANRVINNLLGRQHETDLTKIQEPCIIVSHDLAPSTTAMLDKSKVLGFATDVGSKTSHSAILARSLQIPAVVGLHNASRILATGVYALLDGYNGLLIINPTEQTLFEYGQIVKRKAALNEKLQDVKVRPAVTLDGVKIILSANIERADEVQDVINSGAEGIGLFRTEYLFLNRQDMPDEEEQFEAYAKAASILKPAPVVIRTLDIGGDKFMSGDHTLEVNSFLGWRAIRFCLQEKELFKTQLRAILRASAYGNVKMMYPMISGVDEVLQANSIVEECKEQLRKEGKSFNDRIEIGVMIEIPSAVLTADIIGKHVKFFSLGTNDLIQYSVAADRLNEKVAYLYQPSNPAILRLIKMTIDAGRKCGIWVGVCGEMAGDPVFVPLLIGLGVDELSAAPAVVPQIKYIIRRTKISEAKELARFALECESTTEIYNRCKAYAESIAPELFSNNENHTPVQKDNLTV